MARFKRGQFLSVFEIQTKSLLVIGFTSQYLRGTVNNVTRLSDIDQLNWFIGLSFQDIYLLCHVYWFIIGLSFHRTLN